MSKRGPDQSRAGGWVGGGSESHCCNVHKGYKLEAGVQGETGGGTEVERDSDFSRLEN